MINFEKIWKFTKVIIPLSAFLYFGGTFTYNKWQLNYYGRYTKGIVLSFDEDFKGNPMVLYKFEYAGEFYTGSSRYGSELKPKIGEEYEVYFSFKNPKVNVMHVEE